jgi:hypothetical protein
LTLEQEYAHFHVLFCPHTHAYESDFFGLSSTHHRLFVRREYRQRVDLLKKQLTESKATRNAKAKSKPVGMDTESSASDSSSDDEDGNTDFAVDWRAQHMK